jgi:hypothetical protein
MAETQATASDEAALAEAIVSEQKIAEEAAEARDDADRLDGALFLKLYPLLCKPIPQGFIQTIGRVEGKPYVSTGIRSVQVQIDRMNNVLTPLWWWDEVEYEDAGKLAVVSVYVGNQAEGEVLVCRKSRGGVARGSSAGNIYKGSYTNAAKLAFARLGPGHEVYLGAADLDPDVNQEVADAKASNGSGGKPASDEPVGPGIAGQLVDRAYALPGGKENLQLAASTVAGRDVGDCSERKAAIEGLAGLTFGQAEKLSDRIARKEAEQGADADAS